MQGLDAGKGRELEGGVVLSPHDVFAGGKRYDDSQRTDEALPSNYMKEIPRVDGSPLLSPFVPQGAMCQTQWRL